LRVVIFCHRVIPNSNATDFNISDALKRLEEDHFLIAMEEGICQRQKSLSAV